MKKAEGGGRFEVAMTVQEKRRFLDGISDDPGAYYNMLGRVNVERSECSRAAGRLLTSSPPGKKVTGIQPNYTQTNKHYQPIVNDGEAMRCFG